MNLKLLLFNKETIIGGHMIKIIGLIGLTIIITNGRITESLRAWLYSKTEIIGAFLECSMCVGFWIGSLYSFLFVRQMNVCLDIVIFGGMISLLSYMVDLLLEHIKVKNELLWRKVTKKQAIDAKNKRDKKNSKE